MKYLKFSQFLLLAAIVCTVFSCTKTGPAGATGATGSTGPAGPSGPKGDPGAAGTDSVINNVYVSSWKAITWNVDPSGSAISDTVATPAITSGILDSGFVLIYMRGDSTSAPFQLPYADMMNGLAVFAIQGFILDGGGGIYLQASTPSGAPVGAADVYPTPMIRYIIVPSGTAIPNNISYERVSKLLNIVN